MRLMFCHGLESGRDREGLLLRADLEIHPQGAGSAPMVGHLQLHPRGIAGQIFAIAGDGLPQLPPSFLDLWRMLIHEVSKLSFGRNSR